MLLAIMFIAAGLWGQIITSSITGTVMDTSGAVVPGASVTVSDPHLGVLRHAVTNSTGSYLVPALPAGTYTLTVSAKGFKTYRASAIVLEAARKVRADVTLEVGAVTTQVTVQGSNIGKVQTQTSELGGTVTGKQMTQLELNGRAYTQLITLVPGVVNGTGQDEGAVGAYGSTAYSVNGGRTVYNNFQLDGISNMDMGTGSNLITTYPSIDAIGEERVLTSNYSAQYGQASSGTVVAVIKSGTSQFHGDVYEFSRNTAFDARNFFEYPNRGTLNENDYGFTLGGPVYIPGHYNTDKTKTFFFWSEEWRKEVTPTAFSIQEPSAEERQGDFSNLCPNTVTGSFADCPKNPLTSAYFPGNHMPVDPNARILMGMIPAPNFGSGPLSFFQGSASSPTNWREDLIRVDQNITPKVRMMVHYIHDSWDTVTPTTLWAFSSFPTINTEFNSPGTSLVAQLTASISPTLLNEFIFGYNVNHIVITNNNASLWQVPANFGMKGLFNNGFGARLPGFRICCNSEDGGGAGIGMNPGGFNNPLAPDYNSNPIYTFRDMVTKIAGNHNLTFGADFIAYQKNQQDGGVPSTNGKLTFSSTSAVTTGNAFADFLTGRIANYKQANAEKKYYDRSKGFSLYIEDDWRLAKGLTLNLGFRADIFGWFYNKYNQESNFNPNSYNPADAPEIDVAGSITGEPGALVSGVGNPYNGLERCGTDNLPPECVRIHMFNPAPRFGLAWDPFGHGTTAVRGGYGIFYDQMNGNEVNPQSLEGSPPLVQSPSAFNIVGYGNVGGKAVSFPLNVTSLENYVSWPYVQQWNLDVEHNLGANIVLSVAYVGGKGTHLTDPYDPSQLSPLPLADDPFGPGQPITPANCGPPLVGPSGQAVSGRTAILLGIACGGNPNPYRPYLGYGNITLLQTEGNSDYNALQAYLRKTVGRLSFSLAYTYSHSLDDSSDRFDGIFTNSYDLRQTYANSDFDESHVLSASYVYNLPFFQRSSSRLLRSTIGGWEISGITSYNTGSPFSVLNGIFSDNPGVANGAGVGSFPDICGNTHAAPPETNVPGVIGPLLYNPGAFCAPRGLTFGDAGRNILRNPGYSNWNIGVFKDIPIHGERAHLQFRAEAFNVFNTANLFVSPAAGLAGAVTTGCYAGPNNSAGDPSCIAGNTFLHVGAAHDPRIFQFALKLLF